eukprot:315679_1
MNNDTSYLSILCIYCNGTYFDLSSISNAVITTIAWFLLDCASYQYILGRDCRNKRGVSNADVNGPYNEFILNQYAQNDIDHIHGLNFFYLENTENIIINTASRANIYIGDTLNLMINCNVGTHTKCFNLNITSQLDPTLYALLDEGWNLDCNDDVSCENFKIIFDVNASNPNDDYIQCDITNIKTTIDPNCLFLSFSPTAASDAPSIVPSNAPSAAPSFVPSNAPSDTPSNTPTAPPSIAPTNAPIDVPTYAPSLSPSSPPTNIPSQTPSNTPTTPPSSAPTFLPTIHPTNSTHNPTLSPSVPPSDAPSLAPSFAPTKFPTKSNSFDKKEAIQYIIEYLREMDIDGDISDKL